MNQQIGIWIDHSSAVIVSMSDSQVTTQTLESGVDAHPHYSGGRSPGGEKKYEQRHEEQLDRVLRPSHWRSGAARSAAALRTRGGEAGAEGAPRPIKATLGLRR